MTPLPPPLPTRRVMLAALAATAVPVLGGCSVRVEKDAPRVPGIRPQGPPADQATLLLALSGARSLVATSSSAPGPWGPKLLTLHRAQVARLLGVVATNGITAPPDPSPSPTGVTATALGALEAKHLNPTAWAGAASANPDNAAMLAALLATNAAAATTLETPPSWPLRASSAPICIALLPSVRTAVYALQVIAARTPAGDRSLVTTTVQVMSAARSRLEQGAGRAAPPSAQTYPLPTDPDTQGNRYLLARQVLTGVVDAAARTVPTTRGSVPDLKALTRESSDALSLSWRWGVRPEAFPGLIG